MEEEKRIHEFALKYHRLYANPQTLAREVEEGFAERCLAFGFEADGGEGFAEAFSSDAFYASEELDKVIDDIDDIDLLGSAIFSHWEYAHEAEDSSPLSREHRLWFIVAFTRLAVLTEEPGTSTFIFEGTLQEIQLVSNNIRLSRCPDEADEVEQRLTITADGLVWLSRYRFGTDDRDFELIEKQSFTISAEAADKIMTAVSGYFGDEYCLEFAADVGSWDLALTNTEGKTYEMTGALCQELQTASGGLSDLIRTCLGRRDLFVFDGRPDSVARIEIKYHRNTKIKSDMVLDGEPMEYFTWDYNEFLTIDSASETLEHVREIGTGCKVTNTYYVEEGIAKFLDGISIDAFTEIEGNPPDVVDDPMETREYTITLYTKYGWERTVTGSFDKKGLPADWSHFIENVYEFMSFYGIGELFDERAYGKIRRRESDLIFCNVVFEDGGWTYCYLSDSDDYCVGDWVVVPAGEDNREAVARIESIEYHSAQEAPYPIEKAKHILRRYE